MRSVSSSKMQEIDERAEKEFNVSKLSLMENAGKAIAREALNLLKNIPRQKKTPKVIVVCGRGNNGGDGIACARNLKQRRIEVVVFSVPLEGKILSKESRRQIIQAAHQGLTLNTLRQKTYFETKVKNADVIIDALLGTGSKGKPRGVVSYAIRIMNQAKKPILAIDIPSGLNADTGEYEDVVIHATRTVTLGLAKIGLLKTHAKAFVGELIVARIGHPRELINW